ncbi:uncharacterized protein EAE97_002405 [Botrytis byssoidea]|uniref:HlyIII-domain-containing protein n=1 Tax=Botrytis byssoidea TaxID=139641 RepID=A0A9P5M597_9HELO|nr:uncharacterized protein EAE97_002405 [Botrytis byssoidea]KAF7950853.1 hypothetical protein EAE97_002405 [Botrytis byssoidea]
MSNFESGQDGLGGHDGLEEGIYGYAGAGAYPFFALNLEGEGEREGERRLDGDVSADVIAKNGDGDVSGNGNGDQMVKSRQRQHVRHISSATTLIVAREEEDEGDLVQVPEKVLIIGKAGDGDENGEKIDDDGELGLKRNATGLSMGGLEVLVRDEDIEFEGGGLERFGSGNGDGNGNGIEEGGERIGKILRWDEVAEWRQDNEYILTGYRPETKSSLRSFRSVFHLHNETVNIHSHLIGAILFALLPIYIYHTLLPRYHDATTADLVVFALFFGGVAVCFGLSFVYHTLNNHSHQIAAFWIELDYLGIVALMWGSTVATIYHGFICDVKLQRIYWSMITLLSLALTLFTLLPPFRTPFFRPYRTLMYAALGLSAVIFIVHSIIIYGISLQYKRLSLGWIVGMAGLNFVGALAYSLRIPEKYCPGRFDLYGNSHQILHCMVVLAALAHFAGLVQSFDYLHSGIEGCPVR